MSENTDIEALRKGSVKSIVAVLATLTGAALAGLLEAERADANPRESLITAIHAEFARRIAVAPTDPEPRLATAAEPAHLAADYLGPLTIDQAEARRRKFAVEVKPATVPATQ